MRVVKNFDFYDYTKDEVVQMLNVVTKPCYFKIPFNIPVDSLFRTKIVLKTGSADNSLNYELNNLLRSSVNIEIEAGGWLFMETTDALGKILDTTKDPKKLEYKNTLLQPDNMILIRSASITNITMYIHTDKPISNKLKQILLQKPVATVENTPLQPQLFFINDTAVELNFTGFYQVMGQFMKCELH